MDERLDAGLAALAEVPVPLDWAEVQRRADEPSPHPMPDPTAAAPPERHRRTMAMVLAAAALVIVAGAALVWRGGDDVQTGPLDGPGDVMVTRQGTWRSIAPSPLQPRGGAQAVWTGEQMVVLGGTSETPCPMGAACERNPVYFTDGAAYTPATDSWQMLPDAPAAKIGTPVWTGEDLLVLAIPSPGALEVVLLSWTPGENAWQTLPVPPSVPYYGSAALWAANRLVVPSVQPDSSRRYLGYDPTTGQWDGIPAPDFGCVEELGLDTWNTTMVATAMRCRAEGSDEPGAMAAAVYEPATNSWRQLPDSDLVWAGDLIEADGVLVRPNPSFVDGGDVNPFPRRPEGGQLDPTTGTWSPLAPLPKVPVSEPGSYYALNHDGPAGSWAAQPPYLYAPSAGRWHFNRTSRPDRATNADATVWTGTEIIEWGGNNERWTAYVNTGAAYTPPDPNEP